jgi:hypothetical protein
MVNIDKPRVSGNRPFVVGDLVTSSSSHKNFFTYDSFNAEKRLPVHYWLPSSIGIIIKVYVKEQACLILWDNSERVMNYSYFRHV